MGAASVLGLALVVGLIWQGPRVWQRLERQYGPPPICPDAGSGAGGTWTQGRSAPQPHAETRPVEFGGLIYVAGGMGPNYTTTTDFAVYDPATDQWRELPDLPVGTHHPGLAVWDGTLYLSGGYDDSFTPNLASLWRFDPETEVWSAQPDMPGHRAAHLMLATAGKLYVFGGESLPGEDARVPFVFDLATQTWSSLAPLSEPRDHLAGAEIDGVLYLFGGRLKHSGNYALAEAYDPATDTWRQLADMPTPRSGAAAVAVAGRVHVLGGEDITRECTYATHEVYDPATDTWTSAPALPTPRHGFGAVVVGDSVYVVGGARGSGPRTQYTLSGLVEVYHP